MSFAQTIRRNRFHDFTLIPDQDGPMEITQLAHSFLFGSNMFDLVWKDESALADYKSRLLELWNAGTLPFYWGSYEPAEGNRGLTGMKNAAAWAASNGITLKGHPLCWHTVCADWLMDYETEEIGRRQLGRIQREMRDFKGLVSDWDVVNEAVIMPVYRADNPISRLCNHWGREKLILECFRTAREAAPGARLLINDFDLSADYRDLIARLLDSGCPIDAIGLQTHMHQGFKGAEYLDRILSRFGEFGLPLHFTEITMLSGDLVDPSIQDLNDARRDDWPSTPEGEARQAEEVEAFYSRIYAHPLTQAMTWWDMTDGQWLNAPSGLFRRDGSPKPAWETLRRLIKQEWWYPGSTHQAKAGNPIRITAPEGTYQIRTGPKTRPLTLAKEKPTITLTPA